MSLPANVLDTVLELPVVPSFTRIGYQVRSRTDDWRALDSYNLSGRLILLTGATSGLGKAAATQLATCGASLIIVGRSADRNQSTVDELTAETGNQAIDQIPADMGELSDVHRLAEAVIEKADASAAHFDTIIHNAGALSAEREMTSDGIEATVASQVIGPFLLTSLLLDRLATNAPARVITMASGGMYANPLSLKALAKATQPENPSYDGTTRYALAKRAQVTLNRTWAQRYGSRGVHFHALHPGWADTAGVHDSLPTFASIVGPLLRTAEEGSDTAVWLAADPEPLTSNGKFWHDRRQRSLHRIPTTSSADTPEAAAELWDWVSNLAGVDA